VIENDTGVITCAHILSPGWFSTNVTSTAFATTVAPAGAPSVAAPAE
jgi:hypothetical protein